MDLTPFGQISSFGERDESTVLTAAALAKGGLANVGIEWREERDVNEIRLRFSGKAPSGVAVQYWFHTWPFSPPQMPSIEDPVDDRWQGKWLTAAIQPECRESECVYRFAPLAKDENPRAVHQPGLTYRRTLKIRLAVQGGLPPIEALQAFSGTVEKPMRLRVGLGFGERGKATWTGSVEVQNGRLEALKPWRFARQDKVDRDNRWTLQTGGTEKGFDLDLITAVPSLPGSLDETLVTIRASARTASGNGSRTFTFRTADLREGPIYIPHLAAYVTTDLESTSFTPPQGRGERIRAMIPREPEQSYERASKDIPPQDPWVRQWPGPLYLPLAVEASWQKFAFEIGGNPFISKGGTKAMGKELKRLQWDGDLLTWRIGTGQTPYYREDHQATMTPLNGYIPVVTQKWKSDGFEYEQEAFATLLRGPIDPSDPQRSEQTPAILVMQLRFRNTSGAQRPAHIWLNTNPAEELEVRGDGLYASGGRLRALVQGAPALSWESLPGGTGKAGHLSIPVAAGESGSILLKLPFVSDLTSADIRDLSALDVGRERSRIIDYWTKVTEDSVRFTVPEPNFNLLARGVATHIRTSATKDPVSGMLMLPAASYIYRVYANETCFQTLLLDSLGQHKLAEAYLEPLVRLQGTRTFPGKHKGMEDAIYHGVRVNGEYDYTASTYGLDHGTVLWTLGEHYLYTRDKVWFDRVWPGMRKAIDWIVTQRRSTMLKDAAGKPVPGYGLLPASSLEDNSDWAQWYANNSFSWAGLDRAARALEDLKHPEAVRVRKEADAFRQDLRASVLRATEAASVTRLRDGSYSPWVPVEPYQRLRRFGPIRVDYYKRYGITEQPNLRLSAIREVLYGPIIFLNLGVFSSDEPIAEWILDDWEDNLTLTSGLGLNVHGLTEESKWFSQGGMVFQSNLQNPLLVYLKRHDTPAAIRAAYNNFVACFYPGPNVFTEEYRAWSHASGPFYKSPDEAKFINRLRDMLVLESENTLWLAGGVPRRWFSSSEGVRVDRVTTYFGEVSYSLRGTEPGVIEGEVTLPGRNPAKENWLSLRVPEGKITSVLVDGQEWKDIDTNREAIRLPNRGTAIRLQVRYR